jgi:NAD(P)-dependent dehydrogenase (short-subunit alcohol dehydrogenase family)
MPTVLVTGAGRGLGLEFAKQYSTDGWSVLACVRDPVRAAELTTLAETSGGRVEVQRVDVGDFASIDSLAQQLAGRPIDVLINNAGTMGERSFAREGIAVGKFGASNFDEWAQVFRVNTFAPMKMAEAFIDNLANGEQKKLISLTSVLSSISKNNLGGLYAYRASKAALNAISRSLGLDLQRKFGVTAIVMHPGWVRTEMGGERADIDAATSVAGMRSVIAGLTKEHSGRFWMYDGSEIPW